MKTLIFTPLILVSVLSLNVATAAPQDDLPPAKCEADYASFGAWLEDLKKDALYNGISLQTWNAALTNLKYDEEIIRKDQQQGGFYKGFLDFALPKAHPRIDTARQKIRDNKSIFDRIRRDFGVAPEVIAAFWGMESDFQVKVRLSKSYPILTSMATLAYDCRRANIFRYNLISALKLVEEGDLELSELHGQWAGEMSGLQFKPANYYQFGVDYDNDGRVRIEHSVADMLATAGHMFKANGWKAGQPYILEVKVPDDLPWENADLTLEKKFPISYWANLGVKLRNDQALPKQDYKVSLMLPLGRLGPAFLAYENFETLLLWNASLNNALTAAYLASRVADPSLPEMSPGKKAVEVLSKNELIEFQSIAERKGYDIGEIDGFLGTKTRAVTQALQLKWGLPADSYPTRAILEKFRNE